MSIAENIAAVRERIASAAQRTGRDPEAVSLMAVCKTKPATEIRAAYQAGQRLFGENRVQEFHEKSGELRDLMSGDNAAEFHLIGHLQSNKASRAAELFDAVDSVDSVAILERLHTAALRLNKHLPILIEINIGGEDQKAGIAPDSRDLEQILQAAPQLLAISIRGLMAVPPFTDDPEGARPYFRRLAELRDRIARRKLPSIGMDELSMGMSHDFEVAVEEGSTCVRVGTAIFGARNYT
jgi:hypothetical protein